MAASCRASARRCSSARVYDEDGQLLTGSYMDYAMPRADDAPFFAIAVHPVPATTNVLGAKGCGEAGCAGALPSVMNALVDALSEYGIRHIDMPATPERVWRAIRDARDLKAQPCRHSPRLRGQGACFSAPPACRGGLGWGPSRRLYSQRGAA